MQKKEDNAKEALLSVIIFRFNALFFVLFAEEVNKAIFRGGQTSESKKEVRRGDKKESLGPLKLIINEMK